MAGDAGGVDLDRVAKSSEVGEPATQPDRGVGAVLVAIVVGLRFREVGLETRLLLAGWRNRDERLAEQRHGFGRLRAGRNAQGTRQRG